MVASRQLLDYCAADYIAAYRALATDSSIVATAFGTDYTAVVAGWLLASMDTATELATARVVGTAAANFVTAAGNTAADKSSKS